MLDVEVQHENPSIHSSSLLTISVSVIPEPIVLLSIPKNVTAAPATTIPPPIPPFIPYSQQSTPIPTPTTIEATTSTPAILESTTLFAIHQRVFDLEKEVKILRNVDHNSAIHAAIKSGVPVVVRECLGTNLKDSLHKKSTVDIHKIKVEQAGKQQEIKYTITSSDKATPKEFDQKRALFETMTKTKSFDINPKHRALYHALMESIIEDEDAIEKGFADKLNKRNSNDVNRDEDPLVGLDRGEDTGKTDETPSVMADPNDWFKKPKRPPTPYPKWNTSKTVDDGPTQNWLSDLAKEEKPSKMFNKLSTPIDIITFTMNCLQISDLTKADLVGPVYNLLKDTCKSYVELEYNMEDYYKALNDQLDWNTLVQLRNHLIVPTDYFFNNYLAYMQGGSTDLMYTTSLTKTKAAKYDLKGIEDLVPML
uniref:Uncharacterized protein n=1 Tax=Tanacetum cinerariifolium TaxID=118510 RepID=A0A699J6T4_TANCI|nr:hypothetical protein [Tanacetum cinerariifolium]